MESRKSVSKSLVERVDGGELTVEPPIRDGRNGHAVLECLARIRLKRLQRLKTAVRPSPNRHAVFVDVLLLRPYLARRNLIQCFIVPDIATRDAAQLASEEACAAAVDGDDDVAQRRGDEGLKVDFELAIDLLAAWSGVLVEEHGVLFLLAKVRGSALEDVELEAVDIDGLIVEDGKLVGCGEALKGFVLFEDLLEFLQIGRCGDDLLPGNARALVADQCE